MNLIDGLILHTLSNTNNQSQHSLLMEFYKLDTDIKQRYNEVESPFHDLQLYFMQVKAKSILYSLGILS